MSDTYEDISADPEVIREVVTYTNNVKAIIDGNCISCHSPGQEDSTFPFLTTYSEVKRAVLNTNLLNRIQRQNGEGGLMPEGGRMPQNKIDMVLQWNENGLQE